MSTSNESPNSANNDSDAHAQGDHKSGSDPLADETTTIGAIAANEDEDLLGGAEDDATATH